MLRALGPRWVLEGPVQPVLGPGEDGAGLVGVVADGHDVVEGLLQIAVQRLGLLTGDVHPELLQDRKSTRLNSSHANISYAVFCLKKKKRETPPKPTRQAYVR